MLLSPSRVRWRCGGGRRREGFGGGHIGQAPEQPKLLLQNIDLIERAVEFHQHTKPLPGVVGQVLEAAQQQKPAAFQDLGVLALQGMDEHSTGLVDGLIGEGYHVVGMVDDIEPVRKPGSGREL